MLEPEVFDYISGDEIMFEREPLEDLAKDGQLMALQALRLLAVHGYRSRQEAPGGALGR